MTLFQVREGCPEPLGATVKGGGVNFALFSAHAEKVELCLFDPEGRRETARIALPGHTGDVWHGFVPDLTTGSLYGYRVYGPYDPPNGHRFNPNKLLIDPYAREVDRPHDWDDIHCGYSPGDPKEDLSFDTRDNAALMPKCRVVDPAFDWTDDRPPRTELSRSILYELHVRGHTMRHPAVPPDARGTMAALGRAEIIRHLVDLGVTAVELMPVHPIGTTRALRRLGMRDYWGYNPINFFAVEPRYLSRGTIGEFRRTVRALHDAGIEVILDMVFNHSGEGDELGPTLSFRGIDNASYYWLAEDRRRYVDVTGCRNTLNMAHPRVLGMVVDSLRYWVEELHVDGFRFDLAVTLARQEGRFTPDAPFFKRIAEDPVLAKAKLIAEPWDLGPGGYQLGAFPHGWSEWNDRYRDTMRCWWRGDDGRVGEVATRLAGSSDIFGRSGRGPPASINFVTAHDGFTLEDLASYAAKHNEANGENDADGTDSNFSDNHGVEGPTGDPAILAARARHKRNMMATLLLSQGVPMILGGDELARTQRGNNNPYGQDNDVNWTDWSATDPRFLEFVQGLTRLRSRCEVFRQRQFLSGSPIAGGGARDIAWLAPDGREMTVSDWNAPTNKCLGALFAAAGDASDAEFSPELWLLLMNASADRVSFALPPSKPGFAWHCFADTVENTLPAEPVGLSREKFPLESRSLALLGRVERTLLPRRPEMSP